MTKVRIEFTMETENPQTDETLMILLNDISCLYPDYKCDVVKESEDKIHVCPTIVELIEKYQKLENKYDKLTDRLDEVFVKIRERDSIPNKELSKNEIEPAVRDIVDEIIEEKQRMGEWV